MNARFNRFALGCFALLFSPWLAAAEGIESRPVHFAKGASSAVLKGTLKGDQVVDYTLKARAGQTMKVSLKTDNSAHYFNVLPPGSKDEAVFIGSVSGNKWNGMLEKDGEYTVRLYLMRSAARRHEQAHYTLTVGIGGNEAPKAAHVTVGAADAKVKGTPFHATGKVLCSMGETSPGSQQCEFGVIRAGARNADVHVTPPGGVQRVLVFSAGKVTTRKGEKVVAKRNADEWLIDVNDYERYRIPDAVISGG